MKCQEVQELMPLYVGSDLDEGRARLVAAHVQTCETCSHMAREYNETRQSIQEFVPPAFSDDFYAQMRQGVWQHIEQKSTGPALSGIIADLFRPRLAWALATAVLIAVFAIGIYVFSRQGVPQPVVSNLPSTTHSTPHEQPSTSSPNNKSSASSLVSSGSNSRRAGVHQLDSRQQRNTIHDRVKIRGISTVAAVSSAAISAPEASNLRQPGNGSSDASHAPLRMEIQTKNPNIRIIWFAPRNVKSSSPNPRGT